MLPSRPTGVDETNRGVHAFIGEGDRCLFFGEYFKGKGYQGGPTNQLIHNFKCPTSASPARLKYKQDAINTIAKGLRAAWPRETIERFTWVPIPPSKAVGHPDYDERLIRALRLAFSGYNVDVRALLYQTTSTNADHQSGERISPEGLYEVLQVDHGAVAAQAAKNGVVLFDDMLTTGKHFKCCERRLREALPVTTSYTGLFIARRVFPEDDIEFEDLTGQ